MYLVVLQTMWLHDIVESIVKHKDLSQYVFLVATHLSLSMCHVYLYQEKPDFVSWQSRRTIMEENIF